MRLKCVLLATTVMLATPVAAQTTTAVSPPPADATQATPPESQSEGLADIVVTAQRRSENLQNVPIAVTAVTAVNLERAGVRDVTDLKLSVPTLNVTNSNGYLTSSLRGIGSNGVGPGIENPIALYIDGVYYGSQAGSLLSLNNISQIETLKGPQGTLFGRNATAGLIQITTRTPTSTPTADFNVSYGNYQNVIATAYVGGGIVKNVAADLAIQYNHQGEGWGVNRTTGQDVGRVDHDFAARSKWVFTPLDGTRFTLIGDYSESNGTLNAFRTFPGTVNGFAPARGPEPDYGYDTVSDFTSFTRVKGGGGSLRWDQDIGSLTFSSTTAYRKSESSINFDYDGTERPLERIQFLQKDKQFSQELQLSSASGGRFTWVAGAYYFNATARYDPFVGTFNDLGAIVTINNAQRTRSLAGYAQGTYEIADDTHLTLGGRYTNEKRRAIDGTVDTFIIPIATRLPITVVPDQSATFNKFTYRASLDHRFSKEVLAYASVNRGFKSGGFNTGVPGSAPFRPETLDAYEIGLKTDLFGRRFRVNVAGFYYDYKDIQIQQLNAGSIAVINGAKARDYGVDVDFIAQLSSRLELSGGFGWISPEFKNFPNCPISSPRGGTPSTVGSCAGNLLPLASKFTGNAAANYSIDIGSGKLDLNGNVYYNSGFYPEADNVIRQNRYVTFGANIRYTTADGFSIGAFGRNLSNQRVINFETTIPNGTHTGFYQAPRTYGVNIGYKF